MLPASPVLKPFSPNSINVALASNGATATASSTVVQSGNNYSPDLVINGSRISAGWGTAAGSGWNDGTNNTYPDWFQIAFADVKTIRRMVVVTLRDDFNSTDEPDESLTFSSYGLINYDLEYWDGSAWVNILSVTGNNKVMRVFDFSPVTTDLIRVYIPLNSGRDYSRLVAVEAWT